MIVCAALLYPDGSIVAGPRHFDRTMVNQLTAMGLSGGDPKQGFIDQHGVFYDRKEAWAHAEALGQIKKRVGGDGFKRAGLFSENLY